MVLYPMLIVSIATGKSGCGNRVPSIGNVGINQKIVEGFKSWYYRSFYSVYTCLPKSLLLAVAYLFREFSEWLIKEALLGILNNMRFNHRRNVACNDPRQRKTFIQALSHHSDLLLNKTVKRI